MTEIGATSSGTSGRKSQFHPSLPIIGAAKDGRFGEKSEAADLEHELPLSAESGPLRDLLRMSNVSVLRASAHELPKKN
jgi:hypothetical protein